MSKRLAWDFDQPLYPPTPDGEVQGNDDGARRGRDETGQDILRSARGSPACTALQAFQPTADRVPHEQQRRHRSRIPVRNGPTRLRRPV